MQITIKFTNDIARSIEYYLRKRYKSKASLEKLAKVAILREVSSEAEKELGVLTKKLEIHSVQVIPEYKTEGG